MATRRSSRTASAASTSTTAAVATTAMANNPNSRSEKIKRASPEATFKIPDIPATPPNKRRRMQTTNDAPAAPPHTTPTPSAVDVLAHTGVPKPKRTPAKTRKVAPHATNAPLQTPKGSRIVRYPSDVSTFTLSQSKDLGADETLTTDNLLSKACAHLLSVDPTLREVIGKHHCKLFSPEGLQEDVEPFQALSSGIMAQQVSGAAANSIKKKFIALFPPPETPEDLPKADLPEEQVMHFPTPQQVVEKDIATLRTAGLSQRKAEYIHGLAEKFISGELSAKMLVEASDDEVLEKLVAVRGLGRWSVEMFACFALKRTDIFSTGDIGVQRGMAAHKGRDVAKLRNSKGGKWKYMSEAEMLSIAEPFAPYRSLFMWYMWRIEDVNVEALS